MTAFRLITFFMNLTLLQAWITKCHIHNQKITFPNRCFRTYCSNNEDDTKLSDSLKNARKCASMGLSPGAGLATADEQSDAAYADLINTSMDQRQIDSLSEKELADLERGGKMWEKGSKPMSSKGFLGDVMELFKALNGGAHIEKNKYGET